MAESLVASIAKVEDSLIIGECTELLPACRCGASQWHLLCDGGMLDDFKCENCCRWGAFIYSKTCAFFFAQDGKPNPITARENFYDGDYTETDEQEHYLYAVADHVHPSKDPSDRFFRIKAVPFPIPPRLPSSIQAWVLHESGKRINWLKVSPSESQELEFPMKEQYQKYLETLFRGVRRQHHVCFKPEYGENEGVDRLTLLFPSFEFKIAGTRFRGEGSFYTYSLEVEFPGDVCIQELPSCLLEGEMWWDYYNSDCLRESQKLTRVEWISVNGMERSQFERLFKVLSKAAAVQRQR